MRRSTACARSGQVRLKRWSRSRRYTSSRDARRFRTRSVAEVFVARPGYAYVDSAGVLRAGGTVTLVNAEGTWIIIDTGGPSERSVVLDALDQNDLVPESIDFVVCTHGHIDHVGNNNLFTHATFLLGQDRSVGDAFETVDALS